MMLYEKHTLIFTVQRAVAASADPIYADVDRSFGTSAFFQMYNEQEKELRNGLLLFESEQVTLKIDTVRDIFTHRHILKQSRFNIETLNQLAVLIRDGLKAETRFRVFESLRVLRAQVLAASERLPNHTVKILFEIYRITEWARTRYRNGELADRRSEVIALLLSEDDLTNFIMRNTKRSDGGFCNLT